jgi:hypothetical protein
MKAQFGVRKVIAAAALASVLAVPALGSGVAHADPGWNDTMGLQYGKVELPSQPVPKPGILGGQQVITIGANQTEGDGYEVYHTITLQRSYFVGVK